MRPLDPLALPLGGTQLIEASAGTGKTYTLSTLFVRLLVENKLDVGQILVVTYTRAATAELRDRVRQRVREALACWETGSQDDLLTRLVESAKQRNDGAKTRLLAALAGFDLASIHTIHGFCQDVLARHVFESAAGFHTELVTSAEPFIAELAADFWSTQLASAPLAGARFVHSNLEFDAKGSSGKSRALASLLDRVATRPDAGLLPAPDGNDFVQAEGAWGAAVDEFRSANIDLSKLASGAKNARALAVHLKQILAGGCSEARTRNVPADSTLQKVPGLFEHWEALLGANETMRSALVNELLVMCSRARDELTRKKRALGQRTYDDLLVDLRTALTGDAAGLSEGLRQRYRVALIDEFQDTDPVQYDIFRRVFDHEGHSLILIGDPKQAIYSFRGADVHTYLSARSSAGDAVWSLGTSYRSDPAFVSGLNALYAAMKAPFGDADIAAQAIGTPAGARNRLEREGAPLEFVIANEQATADELPRVVAAHVAELLSHARITDKDGQRPVRPQDIAILCRTNKQALGSKQALTDRSIAAVVHGDSSVLESDEARELEHLLTAAVDPTHRAAVRAAVTTAPLGVSGNELWNIQDDPARWAEWVELFQTWNRVWRGTGFMAGFRGAMDQAKAPMRLLRYPDGERRLTNLLHLAELLHVLETENRLGPHGLLAALTRMRSEEGSGEVAPEAAQLRLESDREAVQVLTIHKSKGLEYPIVYVPYLSSGDLMRGSDIHWPVVRLDDGTSAVDLRGKASPHYGSAEAGSRAENARVLYVALTRARHACIVFCKPATKGKLKKDTPLALALESLEPPGSKLSAKADWKERLESLARTSGGTIGVRDASSIEAPPLARLPGTDAAKLQHRESPGDVSWGPRVASFSSLVAGRYEAMHAAEHVDDRDAGTGGDVATDNEAGTGDALFADLAPGAATGNFLHSIFERIPFAPEAQGEARRITGRLAAARGLDAPATQALERDVEAVLSTPLPQIADGFTLGHVSKRLVEMEFWLGVDPDGQCPVTPRLVADAVAEQSDLFLSRAQAAIRGMSWVDLSGYLRGFIDLVFEHDGRYYVVDYKSNHLGPRRSDYSGDAMTATMVSHDYTLQYLLYTVAVHRHLRVRLKRYDYRKHFGGVLYLFVRGMGPEATEGQGVYFTLPPRSMIERLDAVLQGRTS